MVCSQEAKVTEKLVARNLSVGCVIKDPTILPRATVLHSKRVDFFLTLHVDLFWSIINRNSDFSYYF